MKKITLFIFLLTVSLGYSQDPATGPTDPVARNASDVISIYNGIAVPVAPQYTNISGVSFNNFGSSVVITDETLADGNIVKKYTDHNFHGIEVAAAGLDVTSMKTLHMDVYSSAVTTFRIKLEAVNVSAIELEVVNPLPAGWNSFDIDLGLYSAVDLANLKFIVPVTAAGTTMYIDNVYFWKPDPITDATLSDLQVDGATVTGFSSGTLDYSVVLPKGTTVVPQITMVTKSNSGASETITQASVLPGDATVEVISEDTNTTLTYTVSFSVDTSTSCSGTSSDASEGSYSVGYNYSFETSGTDVNITFELLDTDKTGYVPEIFIAPSTFIPMDGSAAPIYTGVLSGQVDGTMPNFAIRGAYAGGLVTSQFFDYTVGDACVLGTDDFDLASFKIYPNPTQDSWNLKSKSENISSIRVFDILGKSVISLAPNSSEATIDGSSLKSGLYFAQVKTANGVSGLKLVKQ